MPIKSRKSYVLTISSHEWLRKLAAGLAVGGFPLLLSLSANGEKAASYYSSGVTPVEQESDRRAKLLLEEKIKRELQENQRKINQQSKSEASAASREVSPKHKEHGD